MQHKIIELHTDININKTLILSDDIGSKSLHMVCNQIVMECLWGMSSCGRFVPVEYKEVSTNGSYINYMNYISRYSPPNKKVRQHLYESFTDKGNIGYSYKSKVDEIYNKVSTYTIIPSFLQCLKQLYHVEGYQIKLFLRSYASEKDFLLVASELNKFFKSNNMESFVIHTMTGYNVANFVWKNDVPILNVGSLDNTSILESYTGYDSIHDWFYSRSVGHTYLIKDDYKHWTTTKCKGVSGKVLSLNNNIQLFFDDNVKMLDNKSILNLRNRDGEFTSDSIRSKSRHVRLFKLVSRDNFFIDAIHKKINKNLHAINKSEECTHPPQS